MSTVEINKSDAEHTILFYKNKARAILMFTLVKYFGKISQANYSSIC